MKIIKQKGWTYTFTCKHCGSELEAEATDVCVGNFNIKLGGYDTKYYLECEVCEGLNFLPKYNVEGNRKLLPPNVENMASAKREAARAK